jgi:hypothetical protein
MAKAITTHQSGKQSLSPVVASNEIALHEQAANALTTADKRLNDWISKTVVSFAKENGSKTLAERRFSHFNNATARAVGLLRSNAAVIAAMEPRIRLELAMLRHGTAERLPVWTEQARIEGGVKPHNRILHWAKAWLAIEAERLKALSLDELLQECGQ